MPRPATDAPTCVYYCWAGDELLYIGTSRNPMVRYRHHGYGSRWWPRVDAVDIEWFDTRGEAEAIERAAIERYRPTHNSRWHFDDYGPRPKRTEVKPLSVANLRFRDMLGA